MEKSICSQMLTNIGKLTPVWYPFEAFPGLSLKEYPPSLQHPPEIVGTLAAIL